MNFWICCELAGLCIGLLDVCLMLFVASCDIYIVIYNDCDVCCDIYVICNACDIYVVI